MAHQLAVFYFAAFIGNAVFLCGSAWVASRFGVRIIKMTLGVGPKLFKRGKFEITPLPLAASVSMLDTRASGDVSEREHAYDHRPRLVRVSIQLSGPIAILLAAIALRGSAGWTSFLRGFEQLLSGAIAPASRGVELVDGYTQLAEKTGFVAALGVLLAKLAAANLLPIPIVGGGAALLELLLPDSRPDIRDKIWVGFQHVGLVAVLALTLAWLYAIVLAVLAR